MDTKRVNIYAGSILGALLLFLLLGFFSNLIYFGPEHAGGEEEVLAYALEVEDTGEGAGEEAEEVNLAALAAEADPEAGARVFNKCQACHSIEEGDHAVGPALNNVLGADIASAEGFAYTDALTGLEGDWDLETLSAFLENPQGYAPGTKMSFAGIGDPEDRVDVIAYLNQSGDSPIELVPEGAETAAAETETETDATDEPAEGEEAAGEAAEGDQEVATEEGAEPAAEEGAEQTAEEGAEQPAEEGTEQATEEGAEPATEEGAEQAAEEGAEQTAEEGTGDQAGGEFAELLANASAEEGEKVYRKCQACHTLEEGTHRVGPSLYGVIGSDIGSVDGFDYSDAMQEFEGDWTLENLMGYLEKPNEFMPGNKMTFPGLQDPQERIDVFTYIDQADGERDLPQ